MSDDQAPVAVLPSLLRRLASEARQKAALLAMSDPQHSFYAGVAAAADDRLHPASAAIHDEQWLTKENSAFRDGYVKARQVIAHAGPQAIRLMLPTPDRRGPERA